MRCSVVILNWNGAEMLRRYLPSVVQYTTDADTEVVVADNGSTDESLEVLKAFPTVRVLPFTENHGFAGGYNRALNEIDSTYSVLLNSDVEVTAGWLTPLPAYLDAHTDVVACQPKIRSWLHRERFEHAGAAGGKIDALGYPYCRGRLLNHIAEDHGQYDTTEDIFWATGACLCIRTQAYKEAGGLDEAFFAHQEEIDLCWRLQCRGYRLVCLPQSVVYHLGGGALDYENPRKTYLNFRNNLLMIYKNLPENKMARVMFWRWVLDYLAALHFLITGKWSHVKAIFQARKDYQQMKKQAAFQEKRNTNLLHTIIPYPATISPRSILWDYYFRGMRE